MTQYQTKLDEYRNQIDQINGEIIQAIAQRFMITKNVGELKAENNMEPKDTNRENQQKEKIKNIAQKFNVDEKLIENIFELITKEVVRQHVDIKNNKSN